MKSFLIAAAAVLVVLAGCASTEAPATTDQSSISERVYRPGSNILVRERTPLTKEEKEQQAEEARRALATTPRPNSKPN